MQPLIINLGEDATLVHNIAGHLDANAGDIELRTFPDGETYVRVLSDCAAREVILVCGLDQPNVKFLPLLLAVETLRDLGASQVGLITPYLAYMRHDKRFKEGEGITARYFAAMLSKHIDWLVTVDPHLHRIHALNEIYTIPTKVVHAAPLLADWIKSKIKNPVLIGPDSESEQWVKEVAARAGAPFLILEKVRTGDRSVQVSIPDVDQYPNHMPVLVDDIVSTGRTFIETIKHLVALGMPAPVCAAVHGVFADGALDELRSAGAAEIVTCNTILHPTNAMDVSRVVADASRQLLVGKMSR